MPRALIARGKYLESDLRPPVRQLTAAPPGLNGEGDLAGLMFFRQQKPLEAFLEMAFERLVPEAARGALIVGVNAHRGDLHRVEIPQAPDQHFVQHDAALQWRRRIEVTFDDAWIG